MIDITQDIKGSTLVHGDQLKPKIIEIEDVDSLFDPIIYGP